METLGNKEGRFFKILFGACKRNRVIECLVDLNDVKINKQCIL